MKIIADENMPYVQELFGDLGIIETVNGRSLTAEMVKDADVLLVRSVTQVDASLLSKNSQLTFVGSATIGTDHIDTEYLTQRQISFSNAPGCNATAVGEFAFIAMLELANRFGTSLKDKVVGIVGAGNTGSAVARCLQAYGVEVLLHDPLIEKSDPRNFVSLDELITRANVISLHVPITKSGEHKTWYLFDESRLNSLNADTWLLNCCRGEVVDNRALINVKQQRADIKVVLDVWEGEPNPMRELIPYVEFATPHIAGYSLEGKARGTYMLYQKLMQVLGKKEEKEMLALLPSFWTEQLTLTKEPSEKALLQLSRFVYDLRDDDALFRATLLEDPSKKAPVNSSNNNGFDLMRKNHKHRREFSALTLATTGQSEVDWLLNLGYSGVGR
ncbi:4-phosphoerythronate dehydrogenase [Shewanella woodyi]|uniref:Erythronate-4-phosphate dehydrogenase n=1 Tax=Shewanella woodyi (strain ATCC 51908 / MS32) TaxID=392500 RepID=PDXB_SHEWM|nr:4-phosphoerythronate dehydrogenase [Shewanella woodyi]B1KKP1.1 RecName: Full=Erythronate-4-phosphate dehydrogenase [Shewanella woodyi ATCC 51908]ACA87258.1 D-isomer specific 2-hydroxyacid dehydrogenase catalytic region [Shewanella woodyi ATCC 51908]